MRPPARTHQVPRFSVIVNCLNAERYLAAALDSVRRQTLDQWEVVLWDNGSTDGTGAIGRSFDERVRYFRTDETVPLGAARNRALAECRGEFVCFLDSDDLGRPDKLAVQASVMDARPEVDFVYTNYETLDPEGRTRVAYTSPQPEGRVFEAFLRRYRVGLLTVAVRRTALEAQSRRFDESLQYAEEFDFFIRLLRHGQAAYLHQPLAVYRIHPGMLSLQLGGRAVEETRYVLARLASELELSARERAAVEFARRKVSFLEAQQALAYGRMVEAREALEPHKWIDPKNLVLYLLTFIPTRIWLRLRPLWERGTFRAR